MDLSEFKDTLEGLEADVEEAEKELKTAEKTEASFSKALEKLENDGRIREALLEKAQTSVKNLEKLQEKKKKDIEKVYQLKEEIEEDKAKLSEELNSLKKMENLGEDTSEAMEVLEDRERTLDDNYAKLKDIAAQLGIELEKEAQSETTESVSETQENSEENSEEDNSKEIYAKNRRKDAKHAETLKVITSVSEGFATVKDLTDVLKDFVTASNGQEDINFSNTVLKSLINCTDRLGNCEKMKKFLKSAPPSDDAGKIKSFIKSTKVKNALKKSFEVSSELRTTIGIIEKTADLIGDEKFVKKHSVLFGTMAMVYQKSISTANDANTNNNNGTNIDDTTLKKLKGAEKVIAYASNIATIGKTFGKVLIKPTPLNVTKAIKKSLAIAESTKKLSCNLAKKASNWLINYKKYEGSNRLIKKISKKIEIKSYRAIQQKMSVLSFEVSCGRKATVPNNFQLYQKFKTASNFLENAGKISALVNSTFETGDNIGKILLGLQPTGFGGGGKGICK